MKISSLTSNLSFFSLVVLLPIRHLLSYFQGMGAIPVIRGLGLLPLSFSLILFFCFLKSKKRPVSWHGWLFFVTLLVLAGVVILFSPNLQDNLGRSSFFFNISILAYYFIYFIIGFYYNGFSQYHKWIYLFWVLMLFNLLWHYDFSAMRISFQGFEKEGVHLLLGDSFAIWSLLVLSLLTKAPFKSTCVALCSIFALLSFNSRTSLYAFIFVLPLVILLTQKSWKYWVITIAVLMPVFSSFFDLLEYANRRMLAILDLSSDQSMIERNILLEEGILGIQKNWFIGDYAGQLRYGNLGSYIHNYLSLWRQFGILPFLTFLGLLGFFIMKCWRLFWTNIRQREISPCTFFLIVAGGFCFIEIVAARSYVSPYIWFFLGMSLNSSVYVRRTTKKRNLSMRLIKKEL